MPLEIKELHIKVTVNQPQGNTNLQSTAAGNTTAQEEKEALIRQCVEEVLQVIHDKKER